MKFARKRLLALALLLAATQSAYAWGKEGHRLIASVAEAQLSSTAHSRVGQLLALEPGATLASISTWADEHRNPATAPWHYVNFPRGDCQYVKERDCPDGRCVVEAIERQTQILRTSSDVQEQLTALKYLVHLVGDLHQPLHAGWGDDRGGNSYQLQAFMRGTNLHAFWDTRMIQFFEDSDPNWTNTLLREVRSPSHKWVAKQAAEESCKIVAGDDFYPPRTVGTDYAQRYEAVVRERLQLAGRRLAQLINDVWK